MKAIVVIENIEKDYEVLNQLFIKTSAAQKDIVYIPILKSIDDDDFDAASNEVFKEISKCLIREKCDPQNTDLRIVVDLFLKSDDNEDTVTVEDKTGLKLLKSFTKNYYNSFKNVNSFIMSKVGARDDVFNHIAHQLENLEGGMILLNKPITIVGNHHELMDVEYASFPYTDILHDDYISCCADIAFVNAVIYGRK